MKQQNSGKILLNVVDRLWWKGGRKKTTINETSNKSKNFGYVKKKKKSNKRVKSNIINDGCGWEV